MGLNKYLSLLLLLGACEANKLSFILDEAEIAQMAKAKEDDAKQEKLLEKIQTDIATPIEPFDTSSDQALTQKKKAEKSSMASVPLKNINNQQYTGEVFFRNPPQKITVQFDTGSAIVYVLTN